jgi:hypothetical protein
LLLDEGHVVADGTHAELLETTPLYAEILAQVIDSEEGTVGETVDRQALAHPEPAGGVPSTLSRGGR